ncbi:MAG TPA: hypothetical protein VFX49_15740, partial [Chloroflexota bacterium]|nr:hypothetical protein [Chloroflexota bacterium]
MSGDTLGPTGALRRVRLRLTVLYLGAGMLLVLAVCLVAYAATGAIFLRSVDAALERRVAGVLGEDGVLSSPRGAPAGGARRSGHDEDDEDRDERAARLAVDADLAPVFVLPLDRNGALVSAALAGAAPAPPDAAAAASALRQGA